MQSASARITPESVVAAMDELGTAMNEAGKSAGAARTACTRSDRTDGEPVRPRRWPIPRTHTSAHRPRMRTANASKGLERALLRKHRALTETAALRVLSKTSGARRQEVAMKYAWIDEHRVQRTVSRLCGVLSVSRSAYCQWRVCARPARESWPSRRRMPPTRRIVCRWRRTCRIGASMAGSPIRRGGADIRYVPTDEVLAASGSGDGSGGPTHRERVDVRSHRRQSGVDRAEIDLWQRTPAKGLRVPIDREVQYASGRYRTMAADLGITTLNEPALGQRLPRPCDVGEFAISCMT